MDIGPQEQTIVHHVGLWATVWPYVGCFKRGNSVTLSDCALAFVGSNERRPEVRLASAGDYVAEDRSRAS